MIHRHDSSEDSSDFELEEAEVVEGSEYKVQLPPECIYEILKKTQEETFGSFKLCTVSYAILVLLLSDTRSDFLTSPENSSQGFSRL